MNKGMEMEPMTLTSTFKVLLSSLQPSDMVGHSSEIQTSADKTRPEDHNYSQLYPSSSPTPLPGPKLPECPDLTWELPVVCFFFGAD